MLQFITDHNAPFTIAEQAQMMVEAGVGWIEVGQQDLADREQLLAVMEICREADAIMTIESDVDLVADLKVHGVTLQPGDMLPAEAREKLGPNAIIGVKVTVPEQVAIARQADADFVRIGKWPMISNADVSAFVGKLNELECVLPVVVYGDIPLDDAVSVIEAGASGIALSATLMRPGDPTAAAIEYLAALQSTKS